MIDLDDSLSDASDEFDHYQAWAQYHAEPPRSPSVAFLPDPGFRFLPPQRPCGIVGPVLGSACGDCRRCPDREAS